MANNTKREAKPELTGQMTAKSLGTRNVSGMSAQIRAHTSESEVVHFEVVDKLGRTVHQESVAAKDFSSLTRYHDKLTKVRKDLANEYPKPEYSVGVTMARSRVPLTAEVQLQDSEQINAAHESITPSRREQIWISPRQDGRWEVQRSGNEKPSHVTSTQSEAIELGRAKARHSGSALVIQRRDGRIRSIDSFEGDAKSPKDVERHRTKF